MSAAHLAKKAFSKARKVFRPHLREVHDGRETGAFRHLDDSLPGAESWRHRDTRISKSKQLMLVNLTLPLSLQTSKYLKKQKLELPFTFHFILERKEVAR